VVEQKCPSRRPATNEGGGKLEEPSFRLRIDEGMAVWLPKSHAQRLRLRRTALGCSRPPCFMRRRFDPSSSPSATDLGSQPLSLVDPAQNTQQTETF
jgi:hypothetical protein